MASTFAAYYVARSGIQTAQYNLKVTGQNISNVNTDGYTRQRVDSYAVASTGSNMRYSNKNDLGIGQGVESTGVSQLRDPFLDVRYRMEHAKTGKTDTEMATLNDLESIFDEVSKDGINSQFTDLVKQLNTFAASPSNTSLENIVKNSSLLLTKAFHNAAEQLSKIRTQETDSFQSDAIDKVNTILKNIAHVNQEIKSADISQTPALELRDQRNVLLDQLSEYMDIQLSTNSVPVGAGRFVDELSVNLKTPSGDTINLLHNDQYNQFAIKTDASADATTGTKLFHTTISLTDVNGNELKDTATGNSLLDNDDMTNGIFGGYLSMLNDSGEFDNPATKTRGIGYYDKALDKLAYEFSSMMNTANSTNDLTDPTAKPNKPLFTTTDGTSTDKITATNISISNAWNNATGIFMTTSKDASLPGVDNSKSGNNLLYMINQFSQSKTFTTDVSNSGGITLFSGSINTYMSNVSTTLGLDIETITRQNTTYNSTLTEIDTQRQSLSSVDVNEEGINMIMYNQALTAASRFMTTMDEAVDTIINKMGIVGR